MNDTNILPSNEYKEVENRLYLNPNLQVTETSDFIEKLRETQRGNNLQIAQQTQALGTDVPTSLGGLTGAGSYFTSRYQTPQTNSVTQNLRATSRAAALNQALANEQNMWKKRYNDAYRNYQKRSWDKQSSGGNKEGYTTTEGNKEGYTATEGKVEYEDTNDGTIIGVTPGVIGGYTVAMPDTDNGTVLGYNYVPYGEDGKTNYYSSISEAGKDIQSIGTSGNGSYDIITTDGNRYSYIANSRDEAMKAYYRDHPISNHSGSITSGGGGR